MKKVYKAEVVYNTMSYMSKKCKEWIKTKERSKYEE